MGRLRAASLFLAALSASIVLAACGSNDSPELLPGTSADQIESNLELVRQSHAEGNCEEAETAVAEINEEIDALRKVDARLKSALEEGATRLSEVNSSCNASAEAEELKEAEAAQAEEEQAQTEDEEAQAEEEMLEKAQKDEEREEKAEEKEQAEKEAEQPGPGEGKEPGPKDEGEGPGEAEEVEPPVEEEVTPPAEGGSAGGIGPGSAVEGGP